MHKLVETDRCITVCEIAADKIDHNAVIEMLWQLGYHKITAKWNPKNMTPEQKQGCIKACEGLLQKHAEKGNSFLPLITGKETWLPYFFPEGKKQMKEWCQTSSPQPRKFKWQALVMQIMITFF